MKELIEKYGKSYQDRVMMMTVGSIAVNFISTAVNFTLGISANSFWYIVHAAYYGVLVFARIFAVITYVKCRRIGEERAREAENRFYKMSGAFIFLIASAYFLICIYMFDNDDANIVTGNAVYGVAFMAFYKLGFSIYGLHMTKKVKSRIAETVKTISLTDASVSLVMVQCAILNMLDKQTAVISSAIFGMVVSAVFIITGAVMTVRRHRGEK